MDEARRNDDALFEALNKAKRRKRRRRWITVLIILALVAGGILYAVNVLRKRVEASMATEGDEVLTYDASIGSISTRVSGSGTIEDVDTEKVTVPEGVEIDEVMVKSNDKLRKGDLIATLDLTSVLSTLASVQEELDELDKELEARGGVNLPMAISFFAAYLVIYELCNIYLFMQLQYLLFHYQTIFLCK